MYKAITMPKVKWFDKVLKKQMLSYRG